MKVRQASRSTLVASSPSVGWSSEASIVKSLSDLLSLTWCFTSLKMSSKIPLSSMRLNALSWQSSSWGSTIRHPLQHPYHGTPRQNWCHPEILDTSSPDIAQPEFLIAHANQTFSKKYSLVCERIHGCQKSIRGLGLAACRYWSRMVSCALGCFSNVVYCTRKRRCWWPPSGDPCAAYPFPASSFSSCPETSGWSVP